MNESFSHLHSGSENHKIIKNKKKNKKKMFEGVKQITAEL